MTQEMGKVREAMGDVQEAIDMAYLMAGEGRRLYGHTTPSELPNKLAMTLREPVGVCGLVTPWNFPIAIPSWKSLPALICGNTVVIKPSEETPGCATAFRRMLSSTRASLPASSTSCTARARRAEASALVRPSRRPSALLHRLGRYGLRKLLRHRRSDAEARAPGARREERVVVLDDADVDFAVPRDPLVGVRHVGPALHRGEPHHRAGGHPRQTRSGSSRRCQEARPRATDGTTASRSVRSSPGRVEKVEQYVRIGNEEGAQVECGGKRPRKPARAKAEFFEPTVFSGVTPDMRIAQEEIFGPAPPSSA